ncbi:uncharacterized protein LOC115229886 [Octopus sinensis]|uniref:Uncharacterized protein LOC115229886 n=1 Tax=Octopus sinensis TaxID=2607531 RepID=A0A6P7U4Z7_9MOLL|nr:uncharacterized protein LOC115229886 [Octopus sinensis]
MRKGKNASYKPRTRERSFKIKPTNNIDMVPNQQIMSTMRSTEIIYGSPAKTLPYDAGMNLTLGKTSPQVETYKEIRAKEKNQMRDLNTRLAHYIEISRYNEALNKKLREAIEKLKKLPSRDCDNLKKMYEIEMGQIKKLIDECENEKNKAQCAIDDDQDILNEFQERLKECQEIDEDNRERIRQQNDNLADYESRLARLQREIDMENEDKMKNKEIIDNLRNNLNRTKNEITNETFARIESQNQYQILKDELDLQKELNEKELGAVKFVPFEDRINQSRDWWSNEFSKCIQDIQEEYETRLSSIRNELQSNYACKVHEIQTSAARINTESATMKNKYSVLKDSSVKLRSNLNETRQENLLLTTQNEELQNEFNQLQSDYDQLIFEKNEEMNEIRQELEKTLSELQNIMENNMTLKFEIDSYMSLLEQEEIRMGININENRQSFLCRNNSIHEKKKSNFKCHLQNSDFQVQTSNDFRPQPSPDTLALNPFAVSETLVLKALRDFSPGSSGGVDGLRPGHLKDLTSPTTAEASRKLLRSITNLCNRFISGSIPDFARDIFFSANLTALGKKDNGVRPIAVGNIFRRLSAKLLCRAIVPCLSSKFLPVQLGVGVPNGCEAAVHSIRDLTESFEEFIVVKLDVSNAFNSIRRDHLLECCRELVLFAYPLVHLLYACSSILMFNDIPISSSTGVQQGDPLGPVLFALGVNNIAHSVRSPINIWYLDDATICGPPDVVFDDLRFIIPSLSAIGLSINDNKSEVVNINLNPNTFTVATSTCQNILSDVQVTDKSNLMILGAPMGPSALEDTLSCKISNLSKMIEKLKDIEPHVAFFLLRNYFSMPKVLYTLRCAPCFKRDDLLSNLDNILRLAWSTFKTEVKKCQEKKCQKFSIIKKLRMVFQFLNIG